MSKRIKSLLHRIIPNLDTLTTSIYYKQLYDLVDSLDRKSWELENYIIFYKPNVRHEVSSIANYYKVECRLSDTLPEDVLICIIDKRIIEPKINYLY